MLAWTQRRGLVHRMVGAALLDDGVYEEVVRDATATRQAALVVLLGAVAAGIGALGSGLTGLIVGIVAALMGWAASAYIAYWIGTRWFRGPQSSATWEELLRTLGFASSPRLLLVLGIIPVLGFLLSLVVLVWTLVTTVIAIRQALDFDTGRAVLMAVVSWLALFVVSVLLTALILAAM